MTRESKTNIIAMIVIIIILAIGIILRRDYISRELSDTFGRYSDMIKGVPETETIKDSVPK